MTTYVMVGGLRLTEEEAKEFKRDEICEKYSFLVSDKGTKKQHASVDDRAIDHRDMCMGVPVCSEMSDVNREQTIRAPIKKRFDRKKKRVQKVVVCHPIREEHEPEMETRKKTWDNKCDEDDDRIVINPIDCTDDYDVMKKVVVPVKDKVQGDGFQDLYKESRKWGVI